MATMELIIDPIITSMHKMVKKLVKNFAIFPG